MKRRAGCLLVMMVSLFLSFATVCPAAGPGWITGDAAADFFPGLGGMFEGLGLEHTACVIGFGVGTLILLIGQLLFLVCAFGQSPGWGFACLFIPVIPFVAFLLRHWEFARGAYLVILLGGAVMTVSALTGLLAVH